MEESDKQPITAELARGLLGKKGSTMTDKEIKDVIVLLRSLCDKAIDAAIEKDLS